MSLPGERLFQASRLAPGRMRPIIFHAFGKAKLDAPLQLHRLARQGWETLLIAILGMPHCPAAWSFESWKPIGGCCFTGGPVALAGNSAFRFCLLLQWHATATPPSALFLGAHGEDDTDIESARTPSEPDQDFLERTLLTAATDQNSRESGSSLPERLSHLTQPGTGPLVQPHGTSGLHPPLRNDLRGSPSTITGYPNSIERSFHVPCTFVGILA